MIPVKRGDVWFANLNPTVGREQAGLRPVLITSSDYFNHGPAGLVYAVPITSTRRNIRSHVDVLPPNGGLVLESFIMCEAMRSISKERLIKRVGAISTETMMAVEDRMRILLDI